MATERSTNSVRVAELARTDVDPDVRMQAVLNETFDDQEALFSIAETDEDPTIRAMAISKLTDTSRLRELVRTADDARLRYHAVVNPHLDDRRLLAKVACRDKDANVRVAAAVALGDDSLIHDMVRDPDFLLRRAATLELRDQSVLAWLARNDFNDDVRQFAVQNLEDQALLFEFATKDDSAGVRIKAVMNLVDEDQIMRVSRSDDDYFVRSAAESRIEWLRRKSPENGS